MKKLILSLCLFAAPLAAQARDLQTLDCTAATGLKFNYDVASENPSVVVSYLLAHRDYMLTMRRVDVVNGVTGFTLASALGLMTGVVETYELSLHVGEKALTENEFTGTGLVTKTVVNMAAPIPVTSVPVGILCKIAVK
ncbi:MAG: hypothetical protein AAB250_15250 [Bdellovibrionota bacterium]